MSMIFSQSFSPVPHSVLVQVPPHNSYAAAAEASEQLQRELCAYGIQASAVDEKAAYDLVVAIGGDGTIMRAARTFSLRGIPTLGVNGGDVGFLASAELSEVSEVARRIAAGNFELQSRLALRAETQSASSDLIVNEVLLRHPYSLVETEIKVGNDVIHSALPADGVLLATASGSTAYNASVGGPIIAPSAQSVVLSAVSPTILNFRSYVLDEIAAGKSVTFTVVRSKRNELVRVLVDGAPLGTGLRPGESVRITRAAEPLRFATFGLQQYFMALRQKKGFAQ